MDQHQNPALARAHQIDLRNEADHRRQVSALRGPSAMSRIGSAAARLVHRPHQPFAARDL